MIKSRRLRWDEHGDPTLTIVVVGTHDIYRFAHHLEHGQCEFADVGRKAIRGLKRKIGRERFNWLLRFMHGDGGYR